MGGGTEAFPDLGQHCQNPDCNQLDFLPFKCDGCQKVYTFSSIASSISRFFFIKLLPFLGLVLNNIFVNVYVFVNM